MADSHINIDYFNTLQKYPPHVSLLYTAMESFPLVSQIEPDFFIFVGKEDIRDENIAYFRHAWLSQTVAQFATG